MFSNFTASTVAPSRSYSRTFGPTVGILSKVGALGPTVGILSKVGALGIPWFSL